MKAHFKSRTGRLVIEVEGGTIKELFGQIAEVQETLDADSQCGACGSQEIKFRKRVVQKYEYYELQCEACSARLAFGQLREGGGLFPKRRTEKGADLPNRGWMRFIEGSKNEG